MGCACSADVVPAPEDRPPSELGEYDAGLWADLDLVERGSRKSGGAETSEPLALASSLRVSCRVLRAEMKHGITGTMDTTPDGKVYEAVKVRELSARNRARITGWMQRVRAPKRRDTGSSSAWTYGLSTASPHAASVSMEADYDCPLADGYETATSSDSDFEAEQARSQITADCSTRSRAPLEGDLSSGSDDD